MKTFIFFIFISVSALVKSQCVFLYASEKIHGAEIPVTQTDFVVTVNDSIQKKMTSKNDGALGRISLDKGTYKVSIVHPDYEISVKENVIVHDFKTTDVVLTLVRKKLNPEKKLK